MEDNYASGNHERMKETIHTARNAGLLISFASVIFFQLFASQAAALFLSTGANHAANAIQTVGYAALFLRIRCIASPVQMLNYHSSYCMQAMGKGKETLIHACVRELVLYIPLMILLDRVFGETGLAAALPAAEALAAVFALFLLRGMMQQHKADSQLS